MRIYLSGNGSKHIFYLVTEQQQKPQKMERPATPPEEELLVRENVEDIPSYVTAILRYLHTGQINHSISSRKMRNELSTVENDLSCFIGLAAVRTDLVLSSIAKVYQSKSFARVDDVMFALAYCCRQTYNVKLRIEAYTEASKIIDNQHDFLLYIQYCIRLSERLNNERHLGFGHGMRRVVSTWYSKHSALDLANMFGEHRGLHNWTHETVIRKAHYRTKKKELPSTANIVEAAVPNNDEATPATTNGSTANGTGTNEPPGAAELDAAEPDAAALELEAQANDYESVYHFVFCKNSLRYLDYLESKSNLGPGAKRLKELQILKTNENVATAIESLRKHQFHVNQVPTHLLERSDIWEVLFPYMSFRDLLDYFHTIRDFGFLNPDTKLADLMVTAFSESKDMKGNEVCPTRAFVIKCMYDRNVRYLSPTKADFYEKKVIKRKILYNERVSAQLNSIFERSITIAEQSPAQFFITIDLREGNKIKTVLGNKFINCLSASVLLMYSIFRREFDTSVYTFTETAGIIKPIDNKLPRTSFADAKKICENLVIDQTHADLGAPLTEAYKQKRSIDVFVTIVDSIARFNRRAIVPTDEFKKYKKKFNERAKYVVINLARGKHDLKIPKTADMSGFFEISGFSERTLRFVNALSKNSFY